MVRAIVTPSVPFSGGQALCAEGVEDEATWLRLGEMNCDLAQGYWISRPLPAAPFMKWLRDTSWGLKR